MEAGSSLPHSQMHATCPYPEPDQPSPCPQPTSWRPILILSSHLLLGFPSGLLPSCFPHQNSVCTSPVPHTCYAPRPSHSSRFGHPNNIWWGVHIIKLFRKIVWVFMREGQMFFLNSLTLEWTHSRHSKHRENTMQQYAGIYLLQNYSTCFGCLSHPSSGVHQIVTAASGTGHITYQGNNLLPAWPN